VFDEFGFIDAFGGGGADISPIAFDSAPIADTAWTPSFDSSMMSPEMAMGGAGGFDGQMGSIVTALADAGRFDLIPPVMEAAGFDMSGPDPLAPLAQSPAEAMPTMPEAEALPVPSLMSLMTQPPEAPAFMAPWNPMGNLGQGTPELATPAPTPLVINPEQQYGAQSFDESGFTSHPQTGRPLLYNPDGSFATEESITVTNPALNGGAPTNIPSIWGGQRPPPEFKFGSQEFEDWSVNNALQSGQQFPAFGSIAEAVRAAQQRSDGLGGSFSGAQSFDESGFGIQPLQHQDGGPFGTQGANDVSQPDFNWVFGGQPATPSASPSSIINDHFKGYEQNGAQSFDEGGFTAPPFNSQSNPFDTRPSMTGTAQPDAATAFSPQPDPWQSAQTQQVPLPQPRPADLGQQQPPRTLQGYGNRPPAEILPGSTPQVRSFVESAYQKFPGIKLTSAARTPATNAGGAKQSQHLLGNASDWNLSGLNQQQRHEFIQYARSQGAGGIGAYDAEGKNVHVDFRTNAKHAWGPNYSHSSLGQTPQWFQQEAAAHRAGKPATINETVKEANKDFAPAKEGVGEKTEVAREDVRIKGGDKPAPGYVATRNEVREYTRDAAIKRGIDPKVAIKVYQSEGDQAWQSTVVKNGVREESYGPLQFFMGGGLGNKFQKDTGLDPRDPNTWQQQIDYGLDHAAKNGWGSWYGAKKVGITGKMGIGQPTEQTKGPLEEGAISVGASQKRPVQVADAGQRTMTDMPQDGGGFPSLISSLFGGGQQQGGMPAIMGGGGRNPFNDPGSLAAMELIVNSLSRAAPIDGLARAASQDQRFQIEQMRHQQELEWRRQEAQRSQGNSDRDHQLRQQQFSNPNTPASSAARDMGLAPGTPEYKKFITDFYHKKTDGVDEQAASRAKLAEQYGLKKDSPEYRSFILTGKMPREDQQPLSATDKKAILEADEGVLAANTAVESLNRAKRLSKEAYGFPGAGQIGTVTGLFGDKAGQATLDLNNEVMTNALSQMKAIFGGNPTEGERAVLLELQGAANKPDAVRQKIYDRAIYLAQRRLEFNKQRANELRGGSFYKPGGAPATGGWSAVEEVK
jgi:hypothetical protein